MKNLWRVLFVSLALSAVSLFFVLRQGFDPRALSNLVRVDPLGVGLIALCLGLWWLFAGLRLQVLAAGMGSRVGLSRAVRAYILGLFSASVTPAATGSSLATGWYLSRYLTGQQAAGITVYTVVLDLVFYAWSLPASFFVLEWVGVRLPVPNLGFYVTGVATLMLGFAWALAFRVQTLSRLTWGLFGLRFLRRWRRRAYAFVSHTGRTLSGLNRMPLPSQLLLHLLTAALYLVHFSVLNAVAVALGLKVNHVALVALQCLIVPLSFVIPTPGGSGYFELALATFLTGQVPEGAKGLLIVMWRLFSYWLYFIIGPAIGGMALLRASEKPPVAEAAAKGS